MDGRVQTIDRYATIGSRAVISVRQRHVAKDPGHETGGIHLPAIGIAGIQRVAKHAEGLHGSCRARYARPVQRITRSVHYRRNSSVALSAGRDISVAVEDAGEESK